MIWHTNNLKKRHSTESAKSRLPCRRRLWKNGYWLHCPKQHLRSGHWHRRLHPLHPHWVQLPCRPGSPWTAFGKGFVWFLLICPRHPWERERFRRWIFNETSNFLNCAVPSLTAAKKLAFCSTSTILKDVSIILERKRILWNSKWSWSDSRLMSAANQWKPQWGF